MAKRELLDVLLSEKRNGIKSGIYHKTQIEFAYNSNHIEGSQLSEEETRYIYETNTIETNNKAINVDDIIETLNHFRCFDYILENAKTELNEEYIKHLHLLLKGGTSDSRKEYFNTGEYKKLPNVVGGIETTMPENVKNEMKGLLSSYIMEKNVTLTTLSDFHVKFEKIHPFQDGNGRVGRLILFKECLKNNIIPFIISDDIKYYYYRGLSEWDKINGYLLDTFLTCQDKYKNYLDYFKIEYKQ